MSQERVSGFPESQGLTRKNFQGSLGSLRRSLGNFWGTSGLLLSNLSSTVRELPGKSPGNFRGNSGEVQGLSRSSGEPDSLPVTCQICLQEVLRRIQCLQNGLLNYESRYAPGFEFISSRTKGALRRVTCDFSRVRKKGSSGKVVFSEKLHFLEILEILEILESPQTVEKKGDSDHVLETLDCL